MLGALRACVGDCSVGILKLHLMTSCERGNLESLKNWERYFEFLSGRTCERSPFEMVGIYWCTGNREEVGDQNDLRVDTSAWCS